MRPEEYEMFQEAAWPTLVNTISIWQNQRGFPDKTNHKTPYYSLWKYIFSIYLLPIQLQISADH